MENIFKLSRSLSRFKIAQLGEKFQYQVVKFCFDKNIVPLLQRKKNVVKFLNLIPSSCCSSQFKNGKFIFLNIEHSFEADVDWNFSLLGQLWNIRLNSLDYLCYPEINKEDGLKIIYSLIYSIRENKTRFDSHCASLRIINILKFCSRFSVEDVTINEFIFSQAIYVAKNSELHLRNNHLLENGFALLFAAHFFSNEKLFSIADRLLTDSINSQILDDGAHFELCPMYHLWVLNRMIESLQITRNSEFDCSKIIELVDSKIRLMIGWILQIQFSNGTLPAVNDSVEGYGPNVNAVLKIAADLGLKAQHHALSRSGFRKFKNKNFELLVDVNGLTPNEAPGHSHADTFHFILHVFGDPFIIDTGVTTYESSETRLYERSTAAHNTVVVKSKNQSELYGAFRVGRRTEVTYLEEKNGNLTASHNGYHYLGVTHTRSFLFGKDKIVITDTIDSPKPIVCSAFLHLDKKSRIVLKDGKLISKFVAVKFENSLETTIKESYYSVSFGKKIPCSVVKTDFTNILITTISLIK